MLCHFFSPWLLQVPASSAIQRSSSPLSIYAVSLWNCFVTTVNKCTFPMSHLTHLLMKNWKWTEYIFSSISLTTISLLLSSPLCWTSDRSLSQRVYNLSSYSYSVKHRTHWWCFTPSVNHYSFSIKALPHPKAWVIDILFQFSKDAPFTWEKLSENFCVAGAHLTAIQNLPCVIKSNNLISCFASGWLFNNWLLKCIKQCVFGFWGYINIFFFWNSMSFSKK